MARGKRAESIPKPKGDEAPETDADDVTGEAETSAGIGHNSPELTEDQRIALTFMHLKAYKTALAAKKTADADLKNAAKIAKSELGPNAIADIKDMIALETPEGEAKLKQEVERQVRIARWMGLPVGSQSEIFASVDRTPSVDRARAEGKRMGLAGDPCNPPHSPETEQYRHWMEGYHEGQAVLAQGIRPLAPSDDDELDALDAIGDAAPAFVSTH